MPQPRNRSLVIVVAVAAFLALAVAIAAFRDLLPRPLGFLGLGLFLLFLAMIGAIGWETRRDMLALRDEAARGQMIVMLAAKFRDADPDALKAMVRRGGPASEAAALILKGRAERRPPRTGA